MSCAFTALKCCHCDEVLINKCVMQPVHTPNLHSRRNADIKVPLLFCYGAHPITNVYMLYILIVANALHSVRYAIPPPVCKHSFDVADKSIIGDIGTVYSSGCCNSVAKVPCGIFIVMDLEKYILLTLCGVFHLECFGLMY